MGGTDLCKTPDTKEKQADYYFFSRKDKKYPTGNRANRATTAGFWKATGRDKPICTKVQQLIGMRKTLVFYEGRAPHGNKTDWIMHEFRLDDGPRMPAHVCQPLLQISSVYRRFVLILRLSNQQDGTMDVGCMPRRKASERGVFIYKLQSYVSRCLLRSAFPSIVPKERENWYRSSQFSSLSPVRFVAHFRSDFFCSSFNLTCSSCSSVPSELFSSLINHLWVALLAH